MFRVGEFSRIASVTIETLRHYDAIDLFKPAKVDPFTGYRYYNAGQLQTLNQILALKDVGLSLEEIKRLLQDNPTIEEVRDILKAQLKLIDNTIDEAQRRRERISTRLNNLEMDSIFPSFEISLKAVDAFTVAAIRETIPTVEDIPQRWNALFTMIAEWIQANRLQIGFPMALYHDEGYTRTHVDTECAFSLRGIEIEDVPAPTHPIVIRQIDAIPQAATVVVADFHQKVRGLEPAYEAIGQWIANNQYHITAAPREIYYGSPATGDFTAEIQFPVKKA